MPKFWTKTPYLDIFDQKCLISAFSVRILKMLLSYLKSAPSNLFNFKLLRQNKIPKLGTKNALSGYFWLEFLTVVIFEISTLKFVKNESLPHTVNFGIGSTFSKGPGSAFSKDLGPGTVNYKV